MATINIILLFLCLIWSYYKTKDIFHPYVIFCGIWFTLLFLYQAYPHVLYPLTDDFQLTMLLWILSFSLFPVVSLAYGKCNHPCVNISELANHNYVSDNRKEELLYKYCLIFALIHIIILIVTGAFSGNYYEKLVHESHEKSIIETLFDYCQKIPIVFCGYLFLIKRGQMKKEKTILALLISIAMILMAVKTRLIQFLLMSLFLSNIGKRVRLRTLAILAISVFVFFTAIQLFRIQDQERKDNFEVSEFFMHYVLAPLPSMDYVMHDKSEQLKGRTFRFFNTILVKMKLKEPEKNKRITGANDGWVFVPIANNVYTTLYNVWMDYNNTGIIIYGIIVGLFWITIYRRALYGKLVFALFYGAILYALVLQFFDDIILSYTSDIIQFYFWSWLIFKMLKKDGRYTLSNVQR